MLCLLLSQEELGACGKREVPASEVHTRTQSHQRGTRSVTVLTCLWAGYCPRGHQDLEGKLREEGGRCFPWPQLSQLGSILLSALGPEEGV